MTTLLVALAALNLVTFALFLRDKRRARAGRARIPEAVLLQLALLGGSPSAKLAQHLLRHKSRKQPFASRLNRIALVQGLVVIAVALLFARGML